MDIDLEIINEIANPPSRKRPRPDPVERRLLNPNGLATGAKRFLPATEMNGKCGGPPSAPTRPDLNTISTGEVVSSGRSQNSATPQTISLADDDDIEVVHSHVVAPTNQSQMLRISVSEAKKLKLDKGAASAVVRGPDGVPKRVRITQASGTSCSSLRELSQLTFESLSTDHRQMPSRSDDFGAIGEVAEINGQPTFIPIRPKQPRPNAVTPVGQLERYAHKMTSMESSTQSRPFVTVHVGGCVASMPMTSADRDDRPGVFGTNRSEPKRRQVYKSSNLGGATCVAKVGQPILFSGPSRNLVYRPIRSGEVTNVPSGPKLSESGPASRSLARKYYARSKLLDNPDQSEPLLKGFRCTWEDCDLRLHSNVSMLCHGYAHFMDYMRVELRFDDEAHDLDLCQICLVPFESLFALEKHHRMVHGKKRNRSPYLCHICNRQEQNFSHLCLHMNYSHLEWEMPYHCPYCTFRSSLKDDVMFHFEQSHCGTTKMICPLCLLVCEVITFDGLTPAMAQGFIAHLLSHAKMGRNFACHKCTLVFNSEKLMMQHRTSCHEGSTEENEDYTYIPCDGNIPLSLREASGQPAVCRRLIRGIEKPKISYDDVCVECRHPMSHDGHYCPPGSNLRCGRCRFSTRCTIHFKQHSYLHLPYRGQIEGFRSTNFLRREVLLDTKGRCSCGFQTFLGSSLATHLAKCVQAKGSARIVKEPSVSILRHQETNSWPLPEFLQGVKLCVRGSVLPVAKPLDETDPLPMLVIEKWTNMTSADGGFNSGIVDEIYERPRLIPTKPLQKSAMLSPTSLQPKVVLPEAKLIEFPLGKRVTAESVGSFYQNLREKFLKSEAKRMRKWTAEEKQIEQVRSLKRLMQSCRESLDKGGVGEVVECLLEDVCVSDEVSAEDSDDDSPQTSQSQTNRKRKRNRR